KGWPRAGYHDPFDFEDIPSEPGDYLTDRLTEEAVKWIEANQESPFYLHLSLFSVHDPIQGRLDLVEKYQAKLEAIANTSSGPDFILEGNPDDPNPLTPQELAELIEQPSHTLFGVLPQRTVKIKQHQDNVEFAAMVEAMDQSLGSVLTKLTELGLEDDTIVIFFADNGGMSGMNVGRPDRKVGRAKLDVAFSTSNLPLRGAKGWLYEGGIRVPMIIKWPGQSKAGAMIDEPVISTDFYPTLLEVAGLEGSTPDAKSLVPALQGEAFDRGPLYWHFPHYSNHGMQSPAGAIRDGDFKLIEYFENGTLQLFDLEADIGEQTDLAATNTEKTKELHQKLEKWRTLAGAEKMIPNPDYDPTLLAEEYQPASKK
ncbi:MAG: sulfatase-like hydrolase/transferase, partial [Verrucomicrobiota bacterium]